MARLIITHPGQAHRDEFVACCLLLAMSSRAGEATPLIVRRNPTPEEMESDEVIVVDVGGQYDPALNNYDHHQLPREAAAECSITAVLRGSGMDVPAARRALVWLEFTEVLDSKGPRAAAQLLGVDWDSLVPTMSPIEAQILRIFGGMDQCSYADPIYGLMCTMGKGWLDAINAFKRCYEALPAKAQKREVAGKTILDLTAFTPSEIHLGALEAFIRESGVAVHVTVSLDDRGAGLSLYRRDDAPGVDFFRLYDDPSVCFAHSNGFIAKTKERLSSETVDKLLAIACS